MTLPDSVSTLLANNASVAGVGRLKEDDNLFTSGVLDSFTLVDLISVIESDCKIKIPDVDVKAENFKNLKSIKQYIASKTNE
jgi:acyl carrier protein